MSHNIRIPDWIIHDPVRAIGATMVGSEPKRRAAARALKSAMSGWHEGLPALAALGVSERMIAEIETLANRSSAPEFRAKPKTVSSSRGKRRWAAAARAEGGAS